MMGNKRDNKSQQYEMKPESEEEKMLKNVLIGMLLALTLSLSGCGNALAEPSEPASAGPEQESGDEPAREETPAVLTDEGKEFLGQLCRELPDFDGESSMNEQFWRDFLFYSYTGGASENVEIEQIDRGEPVFEETVAKVSLQEAQARAELVLGVELPDLTPSYEDMEEGQTAFYYEDDDYYIGLSDFPDYQYTFSECGSDRENGGNMVVKYTVDFMDESNVGTVTFTISPENNENGFIVRSKTTELNADF